MKTSGIWYETLNLEIINGRYLTIRYRCVLEPAVLLLLPCVKSACSELRRSLRECQDKVCLEITTHVQPTCLLHDLTTIGGSRVLTSSTDCRATRKDKITVKLAPVIPSLARIRNWKVRMLRSEIWEVLVVMWGCHAIRKEMFLQELSNRSRNVLANSGYMRGLPTVTLLILLSRKWCEVYSFSTASAAICTGPYSQTLLY